MDDDKVDARRLIENIRTHLQASIDRTPIAVTPHAFVSGPAPALPSPQSERRAQDLALLRGRVDPAARPLQSHRKTLGWLVIAAKKLVRQLMTPVLEWQSAYNATAGRLLESLDHDTRTMKGELDQRASALHTEISHRLADLDRRAAALNAEVDLRLVGFEGRLADFDQRQGDFESRLAEVEAFHADLRHRLPELERQRDDLLIAIAADREHVARAERKLRRILDTGSAVSRATPDDGLDRSGPTTGTTQLAGLDFDYFAFEERYRGSEAEIKRQHRRYLRHFAGHAPVLDIGCGRGEFLELLHEAGLAARGVDIDLDMVLLCREKGLDIAHDDAFRYLEAVADGSLGGVFTSQFIEHLTPRAAVRLVDCVHRKLRPGGVFVVETINPQCLTVFARSFFLDPSHVWPFHPQMLRFVFETRGFAGIETEYFNPVAPPPALPHLPAAGPDISGANRCVDLVNELLLGPQDYAIAGHKPLGQAPPGALPPP